MSLNWKPKNRKNKKMKMPIIIIFSNFVLFSSHLMITTAKPKNSAVKIPPRFAAIPPVLSMPTQPLMKSYKKRMIKGKFNKKPKFDKYLKVFRDRCSLGVDVSEMKEQLKYYEGVIRQKKYHEEQLEKFRKMEGVNAK